MMQIRGGAWGGFGLTLWLIAVSACGGGDGASSQGGARDGGIDGGGDGPTDPGFAGFGGGRAPLDGGVAGGGGEPDGGCPATVCMGDAGPGCGNGVLEPSIGEACDDGNNVSGDGCSGTCDAVEQDYACPVPGEACMSLVDCGDGVVSGSETCDDGNTADGDGCDADCQLMDGWSCPVAGTACRAAACGDGLVAGLEECDDGQEPPADGDGCDAACQFEPAHRCDEPGQPCVTETCGDGVARGYEDCDDGNFDSGDGCSPVCTWEPVCAGGTCEENCGDGIMLGAEACDDGNVRDGDGCSSNCEIEQGFTCEALVEEPVLPVVYRDFVGTSGTGSDAPRSGNHGPVHRDFQKWEGCEQLVEPALDADKNPVLATRDNDVTGSGNCVESAETFSQWYRSSDVNRTVIDSLVLDPVSGRPGAYQFFDDTFFPLDGRGWNDPNPNELCDDGSGGMALCEQTHEANDGNQHNFHFTSEVRYWFTYSGGERLTFDGDDDVWVFIDGQLAVDLAGLHSHRERWIQLPGPGGSPPADTGGDSRTFGYPDGYPDGYPEYFDLDLEIGGIYEVVVFQAERHTTASQYRLTLENFLSARSVCQSECGDGVVASDEQCDDGDNDGGYGECAPGCVLGERCGDGAVQEEEGEACDDGMLNLFPYSSDPDEACAPGCERPAYCGDGEVDSAFGEQCDDGDNDGGYGECAPGCVLGERCGDGVVQEDEEDCDDGNLDNGDGCGFNCRSLVLE